MGRSEAGLQEGDSQRPGALVWGHWGRGGPGIPRGLPGGGAWAWATPTASAGEPGAAGIGHRGLGGRGHLQRGVCRRRWRRGQRVSSRVHISTWRMANFGMRDSGAPAPSGLESRTPEPCPGLSASRRGGSQLSRHPSPPGPMIPGLRLPKTEDPKVPSPSSPAIIRCHWDASVARA